MAGGKFGKLKIVFIALQRGQFVHEMQLTDLLLDDVVFEAELKDIHREEGLFLGVGLVEE